jgi:hypothetical protein
LWCVQTHVQVRVPLEVGRHREEVHRGRGLRWVRQVVVLQPTSLLLTVSTTTQQSTLPASTLPNLSATPLNLGMRLFVGGPDEQQASCSYVWAAQAVFSFWVSLPIPPPTAHNLSTCTVCAVQRSIAVPPLPSESALSSTTATARKTSLTCLAS